MGKGAGRGQLFNDSPSPSGGVQHLCQKISVAPSARDVPNVEHHHEASKGRGSGLRKGLFPPCGLPICCLRSCSEALGSGGRERASERAATSVLVCKKEKKRKHESHMQRNQ